MAKCSSIWNIAVPKQCSAFVSLVSHKNDQRRYSFTTSANVGRFSKLFKYFGFSKKFAMKSLSRFTTHIYIYTVLEAKLKMSLLILLQLQAQPRQRDRAKLDTVLFDQRPALFAKSCTQLDFWTTLWGIRSSICALSEILTKRNLVAQRIRVFESPFLGGLGLTYAIHL